MKKIAIFGGSGMTGMCAVEAALKKGLAVKALARDPSKFPDDVVSKLDIVQGDVLNLEDVKKTVQGVDGVVVVLGTRNDIRPTTMMSEGMKNILEAMREANIKPVSVCLSAFLFMELDKVTPILQDITKDHQRMLDALRGSDRDWIAVLPPHIAGGEVTWSTVISLINAGHAFLGAGLAIILPALWLGTKAYRLLSPPQSEPSGEYEIKHGEAPACRVISKHDLGHFLVDCVGKPEHYHQLVGIAKKK